MNLADARHAPQGAPKEERASGARSHLAPQGAPNKERASGARSHLETCPLCGSAFDAEGQACRPSCPMSRGCSVVCCPRCGYSFPQEKGLAGRLRRLLDRWKRERRGSTP